MKNNINSPPDSSSENESSSPSGQRPSLRDRRGQLRKTKSTLIRPTKTGTKKEMKKRDDNIQVRKLVREQMGAICDLQADHQKNKNRRQKKRST